MDGAGSAEAGRPEEAGRSGESGRSGPVQASGARGAEASLNGAEPAPKAVSGGTDPAASDSSATLASGGTEPANEVPSADGGADSGADEAPVAEPTVRDAISAPDAEGTPRRTTRRFPLFTRDTARPEGGGRAASRDAPAPARQWPILAVLATVGLGLLLTAFDVFRAGTLLIGAALLGGAVLRWALPDVGMLAVRSRFTDLLTYGVLGVVIVLLGMMAQPNPWLEIPFLDDTLHYTVGH